MSWTKYQKPKKSLEILGDIARFCSELGGDQCNMIEKLINAGNFQAIVDFQIDYESCDVNDVIYARQMLALYTKAPFLPLAIDRSQAAYDRFIRAEEICKASNARLRHGSGSKNPDVESVLFRAQQKISMILGDLPMPSDVDFSFGPGANTNVKGELACPRAKLGTPLECSADLAPVLSGLMTEVPEWCRVHDLGLKPEVFTVNVDVVPGKLTFVPKNAKTDRSICIEPVLNGFFQKGIGAYISQRLRRFGVDLTDQTRNQKLALQGSVDGTLATIDLSMASDCLAKEVVFNLFPMEWAELLAYLRTSKVRFKNSTITFEKFSSMGNGFTFEIESLLFYAVALSCVEHLNLPREGVSVYGDDIIVPVGAYDLVEESLNWLGFSFNTEKSYRSGSFRESCGADFFHGIDIRPFYQKTLVSERTLFTMHNWFIRHCEFTLAAKVAQLMHPAYKIWGPDGYGDGHLIGDFSLRVSRTSRRNGWGGGYFDTYSLKPKSFNKLLPGDSALPVYSVYVRSGCLSPTDPNVVRGSSGYAKISIYTLKTGIFR